MGTAIVTGGASGIGLATAKMLVARGYKVMLADIKFNAAGAKYAGMHICKCDVRNAAEVGRLFAFHKQVFGTLDLLINAAGVHLAEHLPEVSEADFDYIADVNMKGVFLCIRGAVPLMAHGGCIVTISSDAGLIPDKDAALYSASKHWVIGYSKALALSLIQKGIRVNCICPGQTDTPFLRNAFGNDPAAIKACGRVNPMGRLAAPEEIAQAILAVVENPYVNGAVWNVDGGYSWSAKEEPPKIK